MKLNNKIIIIINSFFNSIKFSQIKLTNFYNKLRFTYFNFNYMYVIKLKIYNNNKVLYFIN